MCACAWMDTISKTKAQLGTLARQSAKDQVLATNIIFVPARITFNTNLQLR